MASLVCPCGARLSDTTFPCPHESHLISDRDLDGVTDWGTEAILREEFDSRAVNVLECYDCKRLLVLRPDGMVSYRREESEPMTLLKTTLRLAKHLVLGMLTPPDDVALPLAFGWIQVYCRNSLGKAYAHLKNERTGDWMDVAILRSGRAAAEPPDPAPVCKPAVKPLARTCGVCGKSIMVSDGQGNWSVPSIARGTLWEILPPCGHKFYVSKETDEHESDSITTYTCYECGRKFPADIDRDSQLPCDDCAATMTSDRARHAANRSAGDKPS